MRIVLEERPLGRTAADALVIECYADTPRFGAQGEAFDRAQGRRLARLAREERFDAKVGEVVAFVGAEGLPARRIVLAGMGRRAEVTAETVRRAASAGVRRARDLGATRVAMSLLGDGLPPEVRAQALGEGIRLGLYTFDRHKTAPAVPREVRTVTVAVQTRRERAAVAEGLRRGALVAEATCYARDLVNEPANQVTARTLAASARAIARAGRLAVRVFDRAACERLGMGAFLGVNRGSAEPPRFIHLTYRPPGRPRRRLALIGKGITFDSGGLDLKPADAMERMKGDMAGAAAVLGVMKVIRRLAPPVEVHGFVAATDNMPSGSAIKPGDVLCAMNGKTIEVNNTDAEGRLTLADAVSFARRRIEPDEIVDIATLTGACSIALGSLCAGAMTNDEGLQGRILRAAERAGERVWPLPLIEEYREGLRSDVADLKNTGPRPGGAITAGLFIREFVGTTPWVHLDIAGVAFADKELPYAARGGVGFGTRTLLAYVMASGGA